MNYTPIKAPGLGMSRIVNRPLAQLSAAIAAKALAYSLVRDVKAAATAPQNLDTSWQKRVFTEITSDDDGNISAIASNTDIQIARAGTYCCLASAPALSSSGGLSHKARLHAYHSGDGSNAYVYGTNTQGFTTVVKRSFLFARLELVAGDYVSLQHRGNAACAGGAAYGTDDEIYSMLILWREGALGNYFTPIPVDAAGLAATINSRLASLDAAVAGAMLRQFIYCREEQPSGTAGGDFTTGDWRTRPLNTLVEDETGEASLASNQLTLPAGTYEVYATAPGYNVSNHKLRLYDITNAAALLYGTSERASSAQSTAFLAGKFTLAAEAVIELQHMCASTQATSGFGLACSFSVVEVYAELQLWKVG